MSGGAYLRAMLKSHNGNPLNNFHGASGMWTKRQKAKSKPVDNNSRLRTTSFIQAVKPPPLVSEGGENWADFWARLGIDIEENTYDDASE